MKKDNKRNNTFEKILIVLVFITTCIACPACDSNAPNNVPAYHSLFLIRCCSQDIKGSVILK